MVAEFSNPPIADSFDITDSYVGFIVIYANQLLATKPEAVAALPEKADEKVTSEAIQNVQTGMLVQKRYVQHNLTIEAFSKPIDLPIKDLSAVINKHYSTSFLSL